MSREIDARLQGIAASPAPQALRNELEQAGFADVTFERLSLGIVAIHTARKLVRSAPRPGQVNHAH